MRASCPLFVLLSLFVLCWGPPVRVWGLVPTLPRISPKTGRIVIRSRVGAVGDVFPLKASRVSSYVPSELTEEEWTKLKAEELEAERKMNYGMFGPRFQQTAAPSGNWFTSRSLWTDGFGVTEENSMSSGSKRRSTAASRGVLPSDVESIRKVNKVRIVLFKLLLDVTSVVTMGTKLLPAAQVASRFALRKILKESFMLSMRTTGQIVKLGAAVAFSFGFYSFVHRANRRWLWSTERATLVGISLAVVASFLTSWALVMLGI